MEVQIKATPHITKLDGVECRLWEGVTAGGVPCKVFVHRIAVHKNDDSEQFERELGEKLPPGRAIDLRHIL
jgi:hypothetical protein